MDTETQGRGLPRAGSFSQASPRLSILFTYIPPTYSCGYALDMYIELYHHQHHFYRHKLEANLATGSSICHKHNLYNRPRNTVQRLALPNLHFIIVFSPNPSTMHNTQSISPPSPHPRHVPKNPTFQFTPKHPPPSHQSIHLP